MKLIKATSFLFLFSTLQSQGSLIQPAPLLLLVASGASLLETNVPLNHKFNLPSFGDKKLSYGVRTNHLFGYQFVINSVSPYISYDITSDLNVHFRPFRLGMRLYDKNTMPDMPNLFFAFDPLLQATYFINDVSSLRAGIVSAVSLDAQKERSNKLFAGVGFNIYPNLLLYFDIYTLHNLSYEGLKIGLIFLFK